mmetsp:Transcript_12936/g.23002  ORF Transcript_12936/g.23002 Transcript_12936/m.23002 type:complete len:391 (-) Transcript_12936:258-1430(-)|eukprot:CAMPEP_0175041846 /NCGR_PEP_ID=MMETSP0052_2-20121109/2177_1 /TAXON_ID=51329 ORGANISM="Polytomella parva, Strain SAG 63-3" /NCGR_SAMPLE_ID=MMETSP0052_2 /ASSEMBLY_ACC=CAM_ASM_000194 /LENGTH=390 /DNA_ID=CAMNT_0016304477 /DNA_START=169 /DNA_END=1341 /DNA_ORIENTATION=+
MSKSVFQPVGQKRLTNIAVVRLKRNGERFEIACYRNKVGDWRTGIEKDLDEVLQSTTVFHNVSKGVMAKDKELQAAFGTVDQAKISLEILSHGELQVSDKERKAEFQNIFKDIASVLAEKCINPATCRPYTMTVLERALRDIHFNIDPKKNAKQQAIEAIPLLQKTFPIQRARMRLKLVVPPIAQHEAEALLRRLEASLEQMDVGGARGMDSFTALVDPGAFRELHAFAQQNAARLDVIDQVVTADALTADQLAAMVGEVRLGAEGVARGAEEEEKKKRDDDEVKIISDEKNIDQRRVARAAAENPSQPPPPPLASAALLYRGSVADIPEEHASRKERFAELDTLQPGWTLELRSKGDTVDAVFFHPSGTKVGAYAAARRMALQHHKSLV